MPCGVNIVAGDIRWFHKMSSVGHVQAARLGGTETRVTLLARPTTV